MGCSLFSCHTVDDLVYVLEAVRDEHMWFELGLALGLVSPRLDEIKHSCTELGECRLRMLQAWLKMEQNVTHPSWREMVKALQSRSVNNNVLAMSIAHAHPCV